MKRFLLFICGLLCMSVLSVETANAQCPAPTALSALNIGQNSASLRWTSNDTPLDNCWTLVVGGQGLANCNNTGQASVVATLCNNGGVPTSNNPAVSFTVAGQVITAVVNGLQAGTDYEFFVSETCNGIGTPANVSVCTGPLAFITLDAQYTVSATTIRPTCPFGTANYVANGSFTVAVTNGSTCAGTYTVNAVPVAGSGPAGSTPPSTTVVTYIGFPAGNFLFANAGAGQYTVTVTETGACNPPTDPLVVLVTVPNGVDATAPTFYVTDVLGNILADNDGATATGAARNFGSTTIPEGACGRQDQYYVYGTDGCSGSVTAANAVSATSSTTPATVVPATQVTVTPDGLGFYLVDVFWSVGQTTVTISFQDATGNTASVTLTRNVIDNTDPVVKILSSSQFVIPQCATTITGIVTFQIDDLCDQNAVNWANFVPNFGGATGVLNFTGNNYREYLVTFPAVGSYLVAASYIDAYGNTGFIDQVITVTKASENQPPKIIAAAETFTAAKCFGDVISVYGFTVTDDCEDIVPGNILFSIPGATNVSLYFQQTVGSNRTLYREYQVQLDANLTSPFEVSYFANIRYTPPVGAQVFVLPEITVVSQPDLIAPIIVHPSQDISINLDPCGPSVASTTFEVSLIDDCGIASGTLSFPVGITGATSLSAGGQRITLGNIPVGTHNILITATDNSGRTRQEDFRIIVTQAATPTQLVCIGQLNYSVGESCNDEITPQLLLNTPGICNSAFTVSIEPFGGNRVDKRHIGKNWTYSVTNNATGNKCWGKILVEDKFAPTIICRPAMTISCDAVSTILSQNSTTTWNRPVMNDNCGIVDVKMTIHDFTKDCGGFILRKWSIKDCGGFTKTCEDRIDVLPVNPARIMCPDNVEVTCGVRLEPEYLWAHIKDVTGSDAEATRSVYPWLKTADLAGVQGRLHGVCKFISTYTDQNLEACAVGCKGNNKVIRRWTTLDWCTGNLYECTQVIKSIDSEGPTFLVNDETVSTNPWGCTADFWMPEVWELHDNCDHNPTITVKAADIVHGLTVTWVAGKGWRAAGVPCGVTTFKYIGTDCCGNETIHLMDITVADRTAPVPVTKQNIVVGLTPGYDAHGTADASAKLFAPSVDNGSHDNCSDVRIEIRRALDSPLCSNIGYYGHNNNRTYSSMPGINFSTSSSPTANITWTWTSSSGSRTRDAGVSPTNMNWKVVLIDEAQGQWTWRDMSVVSGATVVRPEFWDYTGSVGAGSTWRTSRANITRADATKLHNFLDTDGGKFVKFCCEDIPAGQAFGSHDVQMRVWDDGNKDGCIGCWVLATDANPNPQQDNFNETWSTVRVENNNPPILVCPKDATIFCDWPIETSVGVWKSVAGVNFDKTGVAEANGACGNPAVEFSDAEELDKCDLGWIRRTFRVPFTPKGSTTVQYITCIQNIRVLQSNSTQVWNFAADSRYSHTAPAVNTNQTVFCNAPTGAPAPVACTGPTAADIAAWEPKYVQAPCDVIGLNVSQPEQFDFEDGVCRKWVVKYKFVNWCDHKEVCYYKTFVFEDVIAPVVACKDTCIAAGANCKTTVTLTKSANDDGGCIPNDPNRWLKWYVVIDEWADGTVDYAYSSFVPTNWNFGGGQTLQVSPGVWVPAKYVAPSKPKDNITITFPNIIEGKHSYHKVTWKVTDGCHNFGACTETIEVKDKKAPTPYCVHLSTALMATPAGSTAKPMVELWARDFDKGSFDGDLAWPCTAQKDLLFTFNGEHPILTSLNTEHLFKGKGLSATPAEYAAGTAQKWLPATKTSGKIWTSDALQGKSSNEVQVNVSVWDWNLNTDFCMVNLKLVCNGNGCPTGGAGSRIAGTVATESNQTVSNVTVTIDANITEYPVSVTTPSNGTFEKSVPNGIDYEVTASKGGDYINGVSTLDLVMIQRHILGIETLSSPYKMIAADVNNDGKVTAQDLTELRKLILGIYNELPNNASWRFPISSQTMNASTPFPYLEKIAISSLDKDMMNQNFVAVKVGDVNGNVTTNVASPAVESRSANTVAMTVAEQTIAAGDVVDIAVTAANFNDVAGFQYTMNLKGASFVGIDGGAIGINDNNIGVIANDVVTMSYASDKGVTVANDEVLFTITVKADRAVKVSEMLSIGSAVTSAEAYTSDLKVGKVSLEVRTAPVTAIELMQNEPNPFKGQTTVSFNMPEAAAASLSVYDVTGKVVTVRNINANKGLNSETFTREQLGASGVMYYTLKSGDFTATKKMIIIE
jgi:hypothetical protein